MPATRSELAAALSPVELRVFQAIHVAIPLGALIFLGVIVALSRSPRPAVAGGPGLLPMLSLVTLVLALSGMAAASFLPGRILQAMARRAADGRALLAALRSAVVVRLAVLEAPALFGLTVCLIGATSGQLAAWPTGWLNAAPVLVLVAVALATWPTRDRLLAQLD